ncbi:hypothetical protein EI555_007962, partial [Monodon monoceros]
LAFSRFHIVVQLDGSVLVPKPVTVYLISVCTPPNIVSFLCFQFVGEDLGTIPGQKLCVSGVKFHQHSGGNLFRRDRGKAFMRSHIVHASKNSFTCQEAGKDFPGSSSLLQHQVTPQKDADCTAVFHSGQSLYKCHECGKDYSWMREALRRQSHWRKKTHACTKYGEFFRQNTQLTEHQTGHATEKDHECSKCKKAFSQRQCGAGRPLNQDPGKPHGGAFADRATRARGRTAHALLGPPHPARFPPPDPGDPLPAPFGNRRGPSLFPVSLQVQPPERALSAPALQDRNDPASPADLPELCLGHRGRIPSPADVARAPAGKGQNKRDRQMAPDNRREH